MATCTRHPFDYPLHEHFPDAEAFLDWEGGCAQRAQRDGRYYLIIDEGMLAEWLPADDDVRDRLVTVFEFGTSEEREQAVRDRIADRIRFSRRRG